MDSRLANVRRLLVRNLRRIGVPPVEVEDVAHRALLKLARCRATDDAGIAAYATEIGKKMWFRSSAQARRAEISVRDWRVHESLMPVAPEERLDARELLSQWEQFAATLHANVRVAAEARIEGATQAEVAARFGVAVTTVDWWLRSVREGFREWLRARRTFERGHERVNGKQRRSR